MLGNGKRLSLLRLWIKLGSLICRGQDTSLFNHLPFSDMCGPKAQVSVLSWNGKIGIIPISLVFWANNDYNCWSNVGGKYIANNMIFNGYMILFFFLEKAFLKDINWVQWGLGINSQTNGGEFHKKETCFFLVLIYRIKIYYFSVSEQISKHWHT